MGVRGEHQQVIKVHIVQVQCRCLHKMLKVKQSTYEHVYGLYREVGRHPLKLARELIHDQVLVKTVELE